MKELQKQFFHTFVSFRKLHLCRMLPGINMGDFTTLKTLRNLEQTQEEVRVSAIVGELNVPASAVSRSLKNLEEKDYVIRYVNKKDRRNTYVQMTPEGEAVFEESEQIMDDFCNAVFRRMGKEDIKRLISYFEKLRDIAGEEIDRRKYDKEQKGSDET